MRTLNRPMFRYGGPIKEGVMSGIREPKKSGGLSKQFNTGLVGDERYPKTDGREHHGFFLPALAWATRFAPAAYRGFKAARTFAPWSKNLGKWGRAKDIFLPKKSLRAPMAASGEGAGFATGAFMRANPLTSFGIASMVPQAGYAGYKVAKAAPGTIWEGTKRWADMVVPGDQSRWWKDKPPVKKEKVTSGAAPGTSGAPGGGDPNMRGDGSWFDAQAEKEAKIAKQKEWNNRIKKYRDIMDIKGMNKEAAYKSLVDASKLIQESGDFKGDIKSGKLINQVIQAASKQFDKPAKTSDAINTLILQNELKKDLSAETDALDKLYKKGRIAVDQKALNPSKSDLVGAYAKAGVKGQALYDNAGKELSANRGQTWRGNLIEDSEFKEILSDLKKNPETQNVDDVTIIATWTQNELNNSKKNIPDGNYTVGSTIVTIKDKQVVDVN